jgi:hypothetical protein
MDLSDCLVRSQGSLEHGHLYDCPDFICTIGGYSLTSFARVPSFARQDLHATR